MPKQRHQLYVSLELCALYNRGEDAVRQVAAAQHVEHRAQVAPCGPDQQHLLAGVERKVDGDQQLRHLGRIVCERVVKVREDREGLLPVADLAGERAEPQQVQRRDRVARGHGAIAHRFLPCEQRLAVVRAAVVGAARRVRILPVELGLECQRLGDPTGLRLGLVEVEQPRDQERVVPEKGGTRGACLLRDAPQAPLVSRAQQELRGARGGARIGGLVHRERGPSEGADHPPVPLGNALVVAPRSRAQYTCRVEAAACALELLAKRSDGQVVADGDGLQRLPASHHAASLELSRRLDAVQLGDDRSVRAEHRLELGRRPGEEVALLHLAVRSGTVGIGRRIETTRWRGHLACDVVEGLAHDLGEVIATGHLPGLQIDDGEQCVVVEHLLEVGHQPARFGGIAMEAADQVIAHPARGHLLERQRCHRERALIAATAMDAQEQSHRQ